MSRYERRFTFAVPAQPQLATSDVGVTGDTVREVETPAEFIASTMYDRRTTIAEYISVDEVAQPAVSRTDVKIDTRGGKGKRY